MKSKLLYALIIGTLITSCSVDPVDEEISLKDAQEINSSINDGCAGPDNSKTLTLSEASAIESWDEVRKLYLSLLPAGVSRGGTFDPSIWNLIDAFNEADNPLGEYTTTYSLTGDQCSDSVELTIIVVPDQQQEPVCDNVDAGPDNSMSLEVSVARAIESWDEVRKLYLSLLAKGVPRDGAFDPSIWDLINAFNALENPVGEYATTYTISDGDCTDSVQLTVNVIPDKQQDPICTGVNAGPDNMKIMTQSEAAALPSWDEVRKLYLSLLAEGVPRNGTFDPSIWDLINAFNETDDPTGDYTTTYTISDGDCTDSVELTIRVVPD
ncbi:hypothetical protein [Salegentibacter chungangensis]|uniref:Adhesin n=1 Tax=Salegentibacter chungangensis TaxID=1335724 RepID=A0ABW3NUE8_9FLAO